MRGITGGTAPHRQQAPIGTFQETATRPYFNHADADGMETVADWQCQDGCPVKMLGEQSGERPSATNTGPTRGGLIFGKGNGIPQFENGAPYRGDTGTASRYFPQLEYCDDDAPQRWKYTAKAGRRERDAGLEEQKATYPHACYSRFQGTAEHAINMKGRQRNRHPTVKPLALCHWLATLIRPPEAYLDEATLCVPFAGSGSEILGALLAGWRNVVGIELSEEYADIAEARIAWWQGAMATTGLDDPKAILDAMRKLEKTRAKGQLSLVE